MIKKSSRKRRSKRNLNYETLLKEFSAKNLVKSISITFLVCFALTSILIFFTMKNASYQFTDKVKTEVIEIIITMTIALVLISFFFIFTTMHTKNKLLKGNCKILKCKVAYKKEFANHGDSNSDYYLYFICNEYGEFHINVTLKEYKSAETLKTEYFLLVAPKSNEKGYKLLNSYSSKDWYCTDKKNIITIL